MCPNWDFWYENTDTIWQQCLRVRRGGFVDVWHPAASDRSAPPPREVNYGSINEVCKQAFQKLFLRTVPYLTHLCTEKLRLG
jgi:hypothetical protein